MKFSSVEVRRATADDAGRIDALYGQLVGTRLVVSSPNRYENSPKIRGRRCLYRWWKAWFAERRLSCCVTDVMFKRQPFAVVENVVVDTMARNQGVGAQLLRAVEAYCALNDCSKIMFLSSSGRTDAHRFFERCGFDASAKRGFIKYRRSFA